MIGIKHKQETVRFTVDLDLELHKALKSIALEERCSATAYWSGTDDQILFGNDADWPGLPAAVLKARRLRLQHADLLIQLRTDVSKE
ncbi:hypothetical protein MITS9509_01558 [Synechococcus sp. MIT S9509]|uniref:hypothetical protein n=1 Tax=unclassified Synechococcus TaxID=2626047 RepID=UPI0007BC0DD6|nr:MULTISPECIES: hypothetical protein [unclassified Synechococcus]KZR88114.1 hypothetical protein MITS9504_00542 [Synechococcus sp. MIT S9504]KZR92101.1 hypothetical protein MITS9509_01558 [Synechococcus sp. MIT S9509]